MKPSNLKMRLLRHQPEVDGQACPARGGQAQTKLLARHKARPTNNDKTIWIPAGVYPRESGGRNDKRDCHSTIRFAMTNIGYTPGV